MSKKCTRCKENKDLDDFNLDRSTKDGRQSRCRDCGLITGKQYHIDNRESENARKRQYYLKNTEKENKRTAEYRINNIEQEIARDLKYRTENPDKVKAACSQWAKTNPDKVNARNNKRRASKLQRTPSYLTEHDFKTIEIMYAYASKLSEDTGIEYQVDHIIPLQGEFVSGFHIPSNLQVITAKENQKKGNRC